MKPVLLLSLALLVAAPVSAQGDDPAAVDVVPVAEVEWTPLNPARGDASPRAGTLWGDRNGAGPTGFLVAFNDGFSSPPHIHNVTYRGVVIHGLVHNDDPEAEPLWMPTGSYWTQPAGDVHITSAQGVTNVAYIEIDGGPYLVKPTEEAFAADEVEVNVDASNVVWLGTSDLVWLEGPETGPEVALLWGLPRGDDPSGALVKVPAGTAARVHSHGPRFRAVVVQGTLVRHTDDVSEGTAMEPGSFVGSTGAVTHEVACRGEVACIAYVRSTGGFDVAAVTPAE